MEHDIVYYIVAAALLIVGYGGYAILEIIEEKRHESKQEKKHEDSKNKF